MRRRGRSRTLVSRKARRFGSLLSLILVAATVAWWVDFMLRQGDPVPPRPIVAEDTRDGLSAVQYDQILALLDSGDTHSLELAEAALWENLADPVASKRVRVTSLRRRTSPERWYREDGARRLLKRLLSRFDEGREEVRADRLLRALLRVHGDDTRAAAGGPLLAADGVAVGGLVGVAGKALVGAPGEALDVNDQVEVLLDTRSLRGGYLTYQLEQRAVPAGAVVELALIVLLERNLPSRRRERVLAILARAPELRLQRLVKLRKVDRGSPAAGRLQDLVALCAPATPMVRPLHEWLTRSRGSLARHDGAFATALAGSDRALQRQVLERLRWEPRPRLDAAVHSLATGSLDPVVRRAALAALGSIPRGSSVRTLVAALDDERWVEPAFAALQFLSGEEQGSHGGAWDFSQPPVEAALARARWRERARRPELWNAGDRLQQSIRSGDGDTGDGEALDRRAAYQLARRGERGLGWYQQHGQRLVTGLDSADPAQRILTVQTIAHWETPAVAPILTEYYLKEDDARVRAALHDALIGVGGDSAVPDVIAKLARCDAYRGLELVRTYHLLFPRIDLLSILARHATEGTAQERAGAAYLLAALPPEKHRAKPLLRLLRDPEKLPRFWAQQSLRRLYGTMTTYDFSLPEQDNTAAIHKWHEIVARSSH